MATHTTPRPHTYRTQRARQTGRMVTVAHGSDLGIELNGESDWWTVCEDHGILVQHRTQRLARWHAPDPMAWCDYCRGDETWVEA